MKLNDPIEVIKGVGEKTAKLFLKLNIKTVQELLEHYPRGYDRFCMPVPITGLLEGMVQTVEASITTRVEIKKLRTLQLLACQVKDPSGRLKLTWFNQPYLKARLRMGSKFLFRGKVIRKGNSLVMDQPKLYTREEYRILMQKLHPVYPLTEGLTNHTISKAVDRVLTEIRPMEDYLPKRIAKEQKLIKRSDALLEVHFPKSMETMLEARKRLVFDEFFRFIIELSRLRKDKEQSGTQYKMQDCEECRILADHLPYRLTLAQQQVWEEIKRDLSGGSRMIRLVQGDVGSGKTILAVLALLYTAINGYQGCIMVPTEVLAAQHYNSMGELLKPFGIQIELLVGSMSAAAKRKAYGRIKNHEADIIIGTHTLFQEKVSYDSLALVITDEQHRFGVNQRDSLAQKGELPHIMVMSATPIPRTLAMILYGDMDISLVNELPADRLLIKNCVVNTGFRPKAYEFIEQQVQKGRQAYIICPMVEESEAMEAENVIDYTEKIKEEIKNPEIAIEYLHGKMKAVQKNEIMERFFSGEIHVLVSTTVVEVGVNVPNATVMMIENAERFGLAQLHQLRGRVGRGKHQSYCIMVSGTPGEETMKRLEIMNRSNDGFYIAEEDLKLRGPGDIFGIRQSGDMNFKLADIWNDAEILKSVSNAVKTLTEEELFQVREALIGKDYAFHKI